MVESAHDQKRNSKLFVAPHHTGVSGGEGKRKEGWQSDVSSGHVNQGLGDVLALPSVRVISVT